MYGLSKKCLVAYGALLHGDFVSVSLAKFSKTAKAAQNPQSHHRKPGFSKFKFGFLNIAGIVLSGG